MLPTILVGQDMGDLLARDAANPGIMDLVVTAETLDAAMLFAQRLAQTDKVIVL